MSEPHGWDIVPLPVPPQQPSIRTAGAPREGLRILIFDSAASPSATGRFAPSRPLENEVLA